MTTKKERDAIGMTVYINDGDYKDCEGVVVALHPNDVYYVYVEEGGFYTFLYDHEVRTEL